jgi:phytoene synthase
VRVGDPDSYLCALFAPAEVREAWFALLAFHLELRDIPHKVSEDMIGFIRFAWWREALDEIYARKTPRHHPVVEALAHAIHAYALPRAPLDALLGAHEKSLLREEFTEQAQVEEYCRATGGEVMRLCALASEPGLAEPYADAGTAKALLDRARRMAGEGAQGDAERKELLASAQSFLARARKAAGAKLSTLTACVQAGEFYLRRLNAGKPTTSPAARVLLSLQLWFRR